MTTLGFCSISALDRPLARAAEAAAAAGFDALEVTARPPHLGPEPDPAAAREAGRAVRAAGLGVVAYGSYLGRAGPRTPEAAGAEVAVAEALETELLRLWAEPDPESPDHGFRGAVALLRAACDAAEPAGITVVVERHVGSFADSPERVLRLLDAVDRPNLALNYQVLDALSPEEVPHQVEDARRLAPLARYLHLKNYRPGAGPTDPVLPGASLEEGVVDVRTLVHAALGAGYDGPMTVEFLSWAPVPLEQKLAGEVAFVRRILREWAGT